MTKAEVCIVDYGTGNIFSVAKSLELAGASVFVSSDPKKIKRADRIKFTLLLPGIVRVPSYRSYVLRLRPSRPQQQAPH